MVLESGMKRVIAIIVGTAIGIVLIWLAYPYISDWLVGPVHGEDQMSANFVLLLVGLGVGCVVGSLVGGLAYSRLKKRMR